MKKTHSLLFRFAVISLIISVVTAAAGCITAFAVQKNADRARTADNVRNVGEHISYLMQHSTDDIAACAGFYSDNTASLADKLPKGFESYEDAEREFRVLFEQQYPGMVFGRDLKFDELSGDVKIKYLAYVYEKWSVIFDDANETLGTGRVCFALPLKSGGNGIMFMGGSLFSPFGNDRAFSDMTNEKSEIGAAFSDSYHNHEHRIVNDGNTVISFTPVSEPVPVTGGNGVYGVIVAMSYIKQGGEALMPMIAVLAALILCAAAFPVYVERSILRKLNALRGCVGEYAQTGDPAAADRTEQCAPKCGELSLLAGQTAAAMRSAEVRIAETGKKTAESVRAGADLNVATKIQADMLPRKFPDRPELDLYAAMTPAKEVGGDFYDYFKIDSDHIGLVMADVSGKGVPAALFMVIAKTLIQDRALMGRSPARVLEYANNRLCENNASGLFVTAWLGVFEISTGKLTYSNAGHEYPAIKRAGGQYELIVGDNDPPIAAMEDMLYEDTKTVLEPGESLFLYTDGVPEAKSAEGKRFGTDRMLEILNANADKTAEELLKTLKNEVDMFSGDDLFDDVTMMCLNYFGKR